MDSGFNYRSPLGVVGIRYNDQGITWVGFGPVKEYDKIHNAHLTDTINFLDKYFSSEELPELPQLCLSGSEHQLKVWRYLLTIPYGKTVSYGEIARAVGSSPRAVGGAVGANPISIIIPCHRVVASNGIGGYHWGVEIKRRLLEIENKL